MEKIVGKWSTDIRLSPDEATKICKLGEGEECCAFLAVSAEGFECIRMSYPTNTTVFRRLEEGTMNAKGRGGWAGCGWEEDIQAFEGEKT